MARLSDNHLRYRRHKRGKEYRDYPREYLTKRLGLTDNRGVFVMPCNNNAERKGTTGKPCDREGHTQFDEEALETRNKKGDSASLSN